MESLRLDSSRNRSSWTHFCRLGVLFLLEGSAGLLTPHETITTKLTWSREISRVVYRRCISCHHSDGAAFSLVNYEEARPWAQAIKEEVLSRRMPPWFAVKGFGAFQNDGGLTAEEIELISDWVEGGAPKGDEKLLPETPDVGAKAPAAPRTTSLPVSAALKLKADTVIRGIRPVDLRNGAAVRMIAQRPNGVQEPLIWIQNYSPRFARSYYFQKPLQFAAGTTIFVTPPNTGRLALLVTSAPKPAR